TEIVISFNLRGLGKGEWDETEFYVEGVDPVHMLGAEPLPGDWDLEEGRSTTIDHFLGISGEDTREGSEEDTGEGSEEGSMPGEDTGKGSMPGENGEEAEIMPEGQE
ncbi:MAG: hypothetical protein KAT70_03460, partial [Thermoplasmata archaeon]|nr:hypothetical protein [Thermoplasmata archaeon]